MKKDKVLTAIRQTLNEQCDREWAKKREVKLQSIFDDVIRIDAGTTQGHIGIKAKAKELWLGLAGSDSRDPNNADWIGPKGNFNAKCVSPFARRIPLTKKIKTKARIHEGTLNAWKEIKANVFKVINKFKNYYTIYVEGQSKGGSIAEAGGENIGFRFPYKNIHVVSISGNCTGNKYFLYALYQHTKEVYKIWVEKDPVPVLPFWFNQIVPHFVLERRDITGFWKKLAWSLLPFDVKSHYPDLVYKLAKEQL